MIAQLNDEQRAAVTLEPRHALVLAGAGSGKTRVLTSRMAWLIQTGQASVFELLAVTFTNKAAREMLTRLTATLPIDPRGLWMGTFHGLCNRMLRAHHRDAGLPQTFQILDTADQLASIKRLLKAQHIDDKDCPPREVQHFINDAKEKGLRADNTPAPSQHRRYLLDLYARYQAQCEREGVVDFAELLLRAYELLAHNAPIREHYQRRFRHILVDEFQDTNTLQYRWLKLLAGGGAHIFAVGDDDQSIYAFRGANVGNMADFERNFAQGTVIRLEQNYRSHGHILDAANALIEHNSERLGKNLWTDQGAGEPIRVLGLPSDAMEADWLVDEIRALINEGRARREITVLYRSNAQSRVIEHKLFSAGIAYKVHGGLRFFERQEIKHALAYLRLAANPDDDTSWMRVVNFPTRGIGMRTLEQLGEQAATYHTSLYGALGRISGKGASNLNQFAALITDIAQTARVVPLPELVEYAILRSGLLTYYQAEKNNTERVENLQELVSAAAAFVEEAQLNDAPATQIPDLGNHSPADGNPPTPADLLSPLAAFLSHAALEAGDNQAQSGQDAIQLMTVHAAKGLEFDAVFITGLEEGLFPHENSIHAGPGAGLEEERRLMYVAITRARERLYLSLAQSRMLHGKTRYAMPSRFLEEIPNKHLKWLTPKAQTYTAYVDSPSRYDDALDRNLTARVDAFGRQSTGRIAPRAPRSLSHGVAVGAQVFQVGQGVHHARFGEGTIINLSGSGVDAQAQIQFRQAGTRTLALGIAKLDILQG